jgi:hypothetical protein
MIPKKASVQNEKSLQGTRNVSNENNTQKPNTGQQNATTRTSGTRTQPCTATKQREFIKKQTNPLALRAGTNRNTRDPAKSGESENNKRILQHGREKGEPQQQSP